MGDCQSREKQGNNGEASLWPSLWLTRSGEQAQMKREENPELRSLRVPSESDKLYREALLQLQRTTSAQSPPSESLLEKLERQFSTPPTSGNASPHSTSSAPSMFLPLLPSSPLQGKGDDQAPQYPSVLDPPTQNKFV